MALADARAPAPPRPFAERALHFVRDVARYGVASAIALAVDWAILAALVRYAGMYYVWATGLAFCAGLIVAYTLTVGFVFQGRRRLSAGAEFTGFLLTGLAGLAVNAALIYVFVEYAHISPVLAKAPVAVFVFASNFLLRWSLLFNARHPVGVGEN